MQGSKQLFWLNFSFFQFSLSDICFQTETRAKPLNYPENCLKNGTKSIALGSIHNLPRGGVMMILIYYDLGGGGCGKFTTKIILSIGGTNYFSLKKKRK